MNSLIKKLLSCSDVKVLLREKFDVGKKGKDFEEVLLKAFEIIGLAYTKNTKTGALWDFIPEGSGWNKKFEDKKINIKITTGKFLFSDASLSKILPWNDIEGAKIVDLEKKARQIKKIIKLKGVSEVFYLKAKNSDIETEIKDLVDKVDVEKLKEILSSKNFKVSKLTKEFSVGITRFSKFGNAIGSITIRKGKTIFARSERPRLVGKVSTVFFNAERPKYSDISLIV